MEFIELFYHKNRRLKDIEVSKMLGVSKQAVSKRKKRIENKYNIKADDINNLPQLPVKNTKEFRTIINGIIDKPSSVILFNWISYTEKSLKQKEIPMTNTKLPEFVESLPY